jgi:DNA adenine methylase
VKPPFTYFGGKTAIADRIAALLPAHEHYVEPFAGSLAVLLAKPPSPMETVSDLDGDLMNFWRILRDRPADLERACALTPHSRAEHQLAYQPAGDDLERARRIWVLLTQGRSGQRSQRTGWRFYCDPRGSHSSMPDYLAAYVSRLAPAAARLAPVSLECRPALDLITQYGQHEQCLIYADPPYLETTRSSCGRGPGYIHELRTEDDHRALAAAVHAARAAVVLSGYDSPLYQDLYGGWDRAEIAAFTGNARTGGARRTEVLWSNRPFPAAQTRLFEVARG